MSTLFDSMLVIYGTLLHSPLCVCVCVYSLQHAHVHTHTHTHTRTYTHTNTHVRVPFAGDLLNNYCMHDPVANVTRLLYTCVIMLTYPIECFVAREVGVVSLWIVCSNVPNAGDGNSPDQNIIQHDQVDSRSLHTKGSICYCPSTYIYNIVNLHVPASRG